MRTLDELRQEFWRRRSPEECVLLACSTQGMSEVDRQRLRDAVARGVDWDVVLHAAVRHQVAPLLFENLNGCDDVAALLPATVTAAFHHATMRNMAAKQDSARALDEALTWFAARGFEAMLVKGTALDHRLYDRPWYTTSADVDLLLRASGGSVDAEVYARIVALNGQRPQVDVHVDRHPDLVMNGVLPVDFAAIWADARPSRVGAHPVLLMRVEDELLAACINACRKRYFRLKSLCEISGLVARSPDLDWPELCRRARAWQCQRIVYAALLAAALGTGCAVPGDLRVRLGIHRPRALLLERLLVRLGFGTLPTIHRHRLLFGKYFSRWLLLPYASMSCGQTLRGVGIALRQMLAGWRDRRKPVL